MGEDDCDTPWTAREPWVPPARAADAAAKRPVLIAPQHPS
jgi:hypothetical protein